jgi:hypothetical protein
MMVVDIYTYEFAETPCTPKLPEVSYEPSRRPSEANDGPINVDYEGMLTIDFCSSCQTYI